MEIHLVHKVSLIPNWKFTELEINLVHKVNLLTITLRACLNSF